MFSPLVSFSFDIHSKVVLALRDAESWFECEQQLRQNKSEEHFKPLNQVYLFNLIKTNLITGRLSLQLIVSIY